MKIEFDFDIDDWMEFQKHHVLNSKQVKRSKIFVTLILPVMSSVFIYIDIIKDRLSPARLVFYVVITLIWILINPKWMNRSILKKAKKMLNEGDNSGVLGKNEVYFEESGIIHKMSGSEHKINWSGIKKLEETDTYYFLYDSALSAIIIPKQKLNVDKEALDKLLKDNIV
jgi:high-affinity Fe2+/Pb2+ permease